VTRIKLPSDPKAHKPADSGAAVGNGARFCSFQEVTFRSFKQASSVYVECATVFASKPAPTGSAAIQIGRLSFNCLTPPHL